MSDGVADVPHDERLYVSQTLLALASSPLSWTGRDARLRVVGYSLGGGVAVHLAAALPELVSSLVLLAPAGLVDPSSFGAAFRFLVTGGVVPDAVVAAVLRKRLRKPMAASTKRAPKPTTTETMATAEAIDGGAEAAPATKGTPLERRVLTYVSWMVANHAGFMSAFISSARHAPLTDQHATFARLADRPAMSTALLMARDDELIIYDDYERDALPLVGGRDHVYWAGLPGGHDFVMTHTAEILRALDNFWGSK